MISPVARRRNAITLPLPPAGGLVLWLLRLVRWERLDFSRPLLFRSERLLRSARTLPRRSLSTDRAREAERIVAERSERESDMPLGRWVWRVPSMLRVTRSLDDVEPSLRRRLLEGTWEPSRIVVPMFLVWSLRPKKFKRGRRLLLMVSCCSSQRLKNWFCNGAHFLCKDYSFFALARIGMGW